MIYFKTDKQAWDYLLEKGFSHKHFIIQLPNRALTRNENEAINYLCDEWDWGSEK